MSARAARLVPLMAVAFLAFGCRGRADAPDAPAPRTLRNPSFDEEGGPGVPGWSTRGETFGKASLVTSPNASPPRALRLEARGRGSSGNDSFMVFQILDVAAHRGRRVRFGARVKTDGAGVNVTLYTPEGFANDFFSDLHSDGFVERSAFLDVPPHASLLSFGIQILGPAGGVAFIDDAFVSMDTRPAAPAPARAPVPEPARVEIDASVVGRSIDPRLFGMHIEWVENGNGLIGADGKLRPDVVDLLRPLAIPVFRFPGGIHADGYDWRLGTGPAARRGRSVNVFTGKPETHLFGTDEYVELLRKTGGAAFLTANYGTGSPEQAAAWVRYLAGRGAAPGLVEVGNEIYLTSPKKEGPNGKEIYRSPEEYARDFPRFRDALRAAEPGVRVGVIAHLDTGAFPLAPADNRDWTVRMLSHLKGAADFVAVHDAYAPVILDDTISFDGDEARGRVYRALYAGAAETAENLRQVEETLARLSPENREAPIGVTEMGPFFGMSSRPERHAIYVDQSRTFASALYVASLLDVLLGDPRVFLACFTNPVHRWYGSLLTDTDAGLVRTPAYYVYLLYRTRFETRLVRAAASSPTFDAPAVGLVKARRGLPDLLARAAISPDGRKLTAMLVNRSLVRTLAVEVALKSFAPSAADCVLLASPSPAQINGPSLTSTTRPQGGIEPRPFPCPARGAVTLTMPPNSVVSLVASR
ncbi:MAG TPA: alpha-L-arabinofuranosidase C-terminal domain-containing protein [Thermoanaerobaculia bacterium]|jgi:alpha-L-arabinofuranosidase